MTSELDTRTLEENEDVSEIQIIDKENRCDYHQERLYTREEFLEVRKKIDQIVRQVQLPKPNDKDREKKIFMKIYQILGRKVVYKNNIICEKYNKILNILDITKMLN